MENGLPWKKACVDFDDLADGQKSKAKEAKTPEDIPSRAEEEGCGIPNMR